ncbi:Trehalase [Globisporangium polare]
MGTRERTTASPAASPSPLASAAGAGGLDLRALIPQSAAHWQRLVILLLLTTLGMMTLSSSVTLAANALVRSSSSNLRTAAASVIHEHLVATEDALAESTPHNHGLQALLDVYCRGPLLHDVQINHVFADSKHFVDMPIKNSSNPAAIPQEYKAYLEAIGPQWMLMEQKERILLLKVFLDQHFDAPGTDMAPVVPFDYQEDVLPPAIAKIKSPTFREWAFQLHKLWKILGRMPKPQVQDDGHGVISTFLHAKPVPELTRTQNVLVVPGGRFRESYYWDSFWIVEGLLVSNMKQTARGVVNNLLEYVAEFGFVPNGGRIYYLTRSQPPMLSDMVKLVAKKDENNEEGAESNGSESSDGGFDLSYLRTVVPILEKEYDFWMQLGPSGHAVEIEVSSRRRSSSVSGGTPRRRRGSSVVLEDLSTTAEPGKRYILNRFVAHADEPRPESYREDFHDATVAFKNKHLDSQDADEKKAHLYNEIIAAAESGWDFTSRWFKDGHSMLTCDTSNVIPVDLNVIMHRFENNLVVFNELLGNAEAAEFFKSAAARRAEAIHALLWSQKHQQWRDFFLDSQTLSPIVSVSNWSPLWTTGLVDTKDPEALENIIESFTTSGLVHVGGIATTTVVTGQQWDAPNAWPPEQDIIIEGLLALNTTGSQKLARQLMRTWVQAGYVAWQRTGLMFEKYNATELGSIGNGGEYIPQFGFGWTNGVILKYLSKYQHLLEGLDES